MTKQSYELNDKKKMTQQSYEFFTQQTQTQRLPNPQYA
jgi:hypothetical protein